MLMFKKKRQKTHCHLKNIIRIAHFQFYVGFEIYRHGFLHVRIKTQQKIQNIFGRYYLKVGSKNFFSNKKHGNFEPLTQ